MDDTSKSVEVKDIKFENFFEVLKTIIYSTIGIIIFFIASVSALPPDPLRRDATTPRFSAAEQP